MMTSTSLAPDLGTSAPLYIFGLPVNTGFKAVNYKESRFEDGMGCSILQAAPQADISPRIYLYPVGVSSVMHGPSEVLEVSKADR